MNFQILKIYGEFLMKQKPLLWMIPLIMGVGSTQSLHGQHSLTFNAGTRIQANGNNMKVDTYASVPCVVDWNEDGKKDLLVGCFDYGNVFLFLNSGSNTAPVFTTGTMLQAGGSAISVAWG